jgi:hypothetical protein
MRSLLGILGTIALGMGVSACGAERTASQGPANAAITGGASMTASSNSSTRKNDRDNDGDHNDDDGKILYYGHAASPSDRRSSIALLMRYFAAAAAEDGAKACSMLAPFVAESVAESEGRLPSLRGKTCTVVMSKLFGLHHRLLIEKNATLRVIGVRVEGDKALAVLEFSAIHEVRQITERRVGKSWRLVGLLDSILE